MLGINVWWLRLGGALACIAVVLGLWFYVSGLQKHNVQLTKDLAVAEANVKHESDTIKRMEADKVFEQGLLSDLAKTKQTIRIETDARNAQVAKQPDGATPPALVCAIAGVC